MVTKKYVVEATAETLDVWYTVLKLDFDWDNPAAQAAYEECSNVVGGGNGGK